jgi:hypothetical protein
MSRRFLALQSAAVIAAAMVFAVPPGNARASTSDNTYCVYVTSMSTTAAYNHGCDVGTKVGAGTRPSDALVILDFGYPIQQGTTWGTLLLTSTYPFESLSKIAGVVEQYGKGYYECSPAGTHLRIGVGENSANVSVDGVTRNYFSAAGGTAWANKRRHDQRVVRH